MVLNQNGVSGSMPIRWNSGRRTWVIDIPASVNVSMIAQNCQALFMFHFCLRRSNMGEGEEGDQCSGFGEDEEWFMVNG